MIHLTSLSMTQLVLIEIGLVLLLISYRIFIKETSSYEKLAREIRKENLHREVSPGLAPVQKQAPRGPIRKIKASAQAMTRGLFKTSKVKFVQTFKFRENDPLHRHLPHH